MYSTRHFKLDTIFLIQFYSAAIIQFGSVFRSDSTPTAKIRLNIPDPTQMIWLKLTHNFRSIFTQISDIILLPLNAYDSSFLIQLRYCSSIWLIISNFFTQYFWINFTLFYKFDLTLTAWIWLTISDLKHYLQFNYNQFSIRFKYHCTNFIFNLTVIADFSALWESSPTSHSKKRSYLRHHLSGGRINILLLVVVEVMLILVSPTFSTRKLIFGLLVVILCYIRVFYIKYDCSLKAGQNYPYFMM